MGSFQCAQTRTSEMCQAASASRSRSDGAVVPTASNRLTPSRKRDWPFTCTLSPLTLSPTDCAVPAAAESTSNATQHAFLILLTIVRRADVQREAAGGWQRAVSSLACVALTA